MELLGEFLMNIIEFHRMDQNNPGDWFSNPCRYFFPEKETEKYDVDNTRKISWHQHDTVIVGGGGLLGNDNFDHLMQRLITHPDAQILEDILENKLKNSSPENKTELYKWKESVQSYTLRILSQLDLSIGPRILWGVGHNSREKDSDWHTVEYPEYIRKFHLVGIRDFNSEYRWVPCASCMHLGFDKTYEIKNEVVWFEHKKKLIDSKWFDVFPAPRMVNTGQNMDQILEFLGSAETVVTNSYHGVYWATLLNRKVVCIPWGSKFNMFKHPPTMANEKNWSSVIETAVNYPDALEECRNANIEFFNDVKKFITDYSPNSKDINII